MWLTGRLVPDHKTIADFRKDNGEAIRKVCARFILVCRALDLFAEVSVAIDGSKFKAVNNRDKNFTRAKMERRLAQIEESVARYLRQLDAVPPPRSDGSHAGSTSTFSKPFSAGSTSIEKRCANGAKRSSIPSVQSRPKWEQHTS